MMRDAMTRLTGSQLSQETEEVGMLVKYGDSLTSMIERNDRMDALREHLQKNKEQMVTESSQQASVLADLWLKAEIDVEVDLPRFELTNASAHQKQGLNVLASFLKSAPYGAHLPALTFEHIGFKYLSFPAALVGEKAWKGLFQDREVPSTNLVPFQLVAFLRRSMQHLMSKIPLADLDLTSAKERLQAAKNTAEDVSLRRRLGAPY